MKEPSANPAGRTAAKAKPGGRPARARAARRVGSVRPVVILVVGMHRSGTSALSRTINLLGAALPVDVLGPSASNPLGHWEPRRTYELHNEILTGIDSSWDDWSAIGKEWFSSLDAEAQARKLARFMKDETAEHPLFVVKDPRICKVVPLWRRAAALAKVDLRVVIPVRHPFEVAASLEARNGFTRSKALLIWLRYVLEAERSTRDLTRVIVAYEDLLTGWRPVMRRIGEHLGISWPRWTRKAEHEIDNFLNPEHRHHSVCDLGAGLEAPAALWTGPTYDALRRLAAGEEEESARSALDGVGAAFDGACSVFGPLMFEELARQHETAETHRLQVKHERNVAQKEVQRLTVELEQRDAALQSSQEERDALAAGARAADDQLAALKASLSSARAHEAELAARVAEGDEELSRLRASLSAAKTHEAELAARVAEGDEELSKLRASLSSAKAHEAELAARVGEEDEELSRLRASLSSAKAHEAELAARVAEEHEELSRLRASLSATEAHEAELAARVGEEDEELSRLRDSLSSAEAREVELAVRAREADQELAALRDNLSSAQTERSRLEALLEDRAQELEQMTVVVRQHNQRVSELEARSAELHLSLTHAEHSLRERATALELATGRLTEAERLRAQGERTVGGLQRDVEAAHAMVFQLRAATMELAKQKETQARLTAEIQRLEQQLGEVRLQIATVRAERAKGQADLVRRERQISRLRSTEARLRERMGQFERAIEDLNGQGLWKAASGLGRAASSVRSLAGGRTDAARRRGRAEILASGLFDADWYVRSNPEAAVALTDPLDHYLAQGAAVRSSPHPLFDPRWYLAFNRQAAPDAADPLLDYLRSGGAEGASPHPLFDSAWYLESNPDVAASGINPLVHYLRHGWREGRDPHPLFDTRAYLQANPDVAASGANPLVHYVLHGMDEGRAASEGLGPAVLRALAASALFDAEGYAVAHPGVHQSGVDPALHFMLWGARQRLSPHVMFDVGWYLDQNGLALGPRVNPLVHFLDEGWKEGLSPHPLFDVRWYLSANPKVARSGENPLVHFVQAGWRKGRSPHPSVDVSPYFEPGGTRPAAKVDPLAEFVAWAFERLAQTVETPETPARTAAAAL